MTSIVASTCQALKLSVVEFGELCSTNAATAPHDVHLRIHLDILSRRASVNSVFSISERPHVRGANAKIIETVPNGACGDTVAHASSANPAGIWNNQGQLDFQRSGLVANRIVLAQELLSFCTYRRFVTLTDLAETCNQR